MWHVEPTSLQDGVPQFEGEDEAEEPNRNDLYNVGFRHQVLHGIIVLEGQGQLGVVIHGSDSESKRDAGHAGGHSHDDFAMEGRCSDTYDPYLDTERGEDESGDHNSEDVDGNVGSKVSPGDSIPGLTHHRIGIVEVAGNPGAKEQTTYAVGEQTCRVEEKDGGFSLLGLGQDEKSHQKHQRRAKSNSVADTNTEVIDAPSVEVLPAPV